MSLLLAGCGDRNNESTARAIPAAAPAPMAAVAVSGSANAAEHRLNNSASEMSGSANAAEHRLNITAPG